MTHEEPPHSADTDPQEPSGELERVDTVDEDAKPGGSSTTQAERQNAVEALDAAAQTNDGAALVDIFQHFLDREITADTYSQLFRAASLCVNADAFATIIRASQRMSTGDLRGYVDSYGLSEAAQRLVLKIVTLYGGPLIGAYYKTDLPHAGDDWSYIVDTVRLDVETGEYVVELIIRKNNGESFVIRGGEHSPGRLARQLLMAVLKLDPDVLTTRDTTELLRTMDEVRSMLAMRATSDKEALGDASETD